LKNYISYSLYGTDTYYVRGAIENIRNNCVILPDWTSIIYLSTKMRHEFEHLFLELPCKLIEVQAIENNTSMLWRYFATNLTDAEFIIFRDCDSLITLREKSMIEDWVVDEKALHIIRDHPMHTALIMGGLCGVKKDRVHNLYESFIKSKFVDLYGMDQWFIHKELYKKYKNDALIHDSIASAGKEIDPLALGIHKSDYIGKRLPRLPGEMNSTMIFEEKLNFGLSKKVRFKSLRDLRVKLKNSKNYLYFQLKVAFYGKKVQINLFD
jgi:hypothetical protein